MAKIIPDPSAIREFKDVKSFEKWLNTNHDRASEVFVRIAKKGSGLASVSYAEALDVALCWGWIDAVRLSFDEASFLQRYTPRTKKSIWSQINRDHVQRLIDAGRMTPHGLVQVDAAKLDGRWDAAYAPARVTSVPDDLCAAIEANPKARKTFATLTKQNLFALAFRLGRIKTPSAREKRIAAFVEMLARGETPHPQTKK